MKNIFLIAMIFIAGFTQKANAQDAAKSAFNKMVGTYFNTKNALAKDNKELAVTGAKSILASINNFPVKSLDKSQTEMWQNFSGEVKKAALPMVNEKELKSQREQFKNVSYAMIKLVKGIKLNDKIIYLQHCPMAKASWLNEVEAVENPYYGSMMFDCGDVKETIAKQ